MFCHKCGANVEPNAQFCPSCGQTVGADVPPPQPNMPQPYAPPATAQVQTGKWIGEAWELVKTDLLMFAVAALLFAVVGGAIPVVLQGAMAVGFNILALPQNLWVSTHRNEA